MTNKQKREQALIEAIKMIIGMGCILYVIFTICAILDYGWIRGLSVSAIIGGTAGIIGIALWDDIYNN